uniref:Glutamine synthetase n=1 Tax=Culicoides sonorensis TaxID=179676 RepID=A0A336MI44_CULSO
MALRAFGVLIVNSSRQQTARRMISTTSQVHAKILKDSPNAQLSKHVLSRYTNLKYDPKYVQATYVWIDGTGENVRCKDRVLTKRVERPEDAPNWQYDGSSTYQALGGNSDCTLVPRAVYQDPFKAGGQDVIVLCDTYKPDGAPTDTNHRNKMQDAFDRTKSHEPWFGIEQEYTLLDIDLRPLGWPVGGFPVMPSQWEYQCGPSLGMKAADDIWVSRYILWRVAEEFGVVVTFDPKPMEGNWNGAGGHCNFSTKEMRADGGMEAIKAAIEKLSHKQEKHIKAYDPKGGADNARRLVGKLETSSIHKFSWGIADRGSSVRIPRGVANAGKGYLEDRRPSSNMDPYATNKEN